MNSTDGEKESKEAKPVPSWVKPTPEPEEGEEEQFAKRRLSVTNPFGDNEDDADWEKEED